ncbi:hypothetical protein, partial [Klebsiella pneumoniae]|uniref:hypothetical protein n=1 Tax=Klebsiella pneumoniae TaxID=573 RepID=UPI0040557A75
TQFGRRGRKIHLSTFSRGGKPVNALESEVNPQVILSECFDEYGNDKTNSLGTNHSQESSNDQIHIADEDKILNIEQNQLILEKGIKFPGYNAFFL